MLTIQIDCHVLTMYSITSVKRLIVLRYVNYQLEILPLNPRNRTFVRRFNLEGFMMDQDKDQTKSANTVSLSTIMLDSPQSLIPPSQARLATAKNTRIARQPSPTIPMSVGQQEEKGPLRLRGGCIPLPCVRFLSLFSHIEAEPAHRRGGVAPLFRAVVNCCINKGSGSESTYFYRSESLIDFLTLNPDLISIFSNVLALSKRSRR